MRDWRRLGIRAAQVGLLSAITYAVPFFSDICSFDIRTWVNGVVVKGS